MDPQRYIEQLLDDESVTDGLADAEAAALLAAASQELETRLAAVTDHDSAMKTAAEIRRIARTLSQVTQKLCDDEDGDAAQACWAKGDIPDHGNHDIRNLAGMAAATVVDRLLQRVWPRER